MWRQIIWNEEPGGNVAHIEEHGLTVADVEHVLANFESRGQSHSTAFRPSSAVVWCTARSPRFGARCAITRRWRRLPQTLLPLTLPPL